MDQRADGLKGLFNMAELTPFFVLLRLVAAAARTPLTGSPGRFSATSDPLRERQTGLSGFWWFGHRVTTRRRWYRH